MVVDELELFDRHFQWSFTAGSLTVFSFLPDLLQVLTFLHLRLSFQARSYAVLYHHLPPFYCLHYLYYVLLYSTNYTCLQRCIHICLDF